MITVTSSAVCISVFLALIGLQALFVASEVAIKRSKSSKLRVLARSGRGSARYARIILIHADKFLIAAQIGVFLCAVALGLFLACAWQGTGSTTETGILMTKNVVLSTVILALLSASLIITQVIRSVSNSYPETVLCLVSRTFIVGAILLSPFVAVVRSSAALLASMFGLKRIIARRSSISPEELTELVAMSSNAGEIDDEERELIERVFSLSERLVSEVMTPRADIVFVHDGESFEAVLKIFATERLSRVVVVGKDLDEVRGVLLLKDLFPLLLNGVTVANIKSLMRKAVFVAGDKSVDSVLRELRRQALHMAVVLDEHGGVHGVVTLEDLVQELIGEIADEYDSPHAAVGVQKMPNGDLVIDGSANIESLNESYRLGIPEGEYATLAGYVLHSLGRIPSSGESFKINNRVFVVEESEPNRIQTVRILRAAKSKLSQGIARQVSRISRKNRATAEHASIKTTRIAGAGKLI